MVCRTVMCRVKKFRAMRTALREPEMPEPMAVAVRILEAAVTMEPLAAVEQVETQAPEPLPRQRLRQLRPRHRSLTHLEPQTTVEMGTVLQATLRKMMVHPDRQPDLYNITEA